tara:strand:- start:459 stop:680 length:222 start_codon:yes stop_codon:yes gene_type:complete
MSELYIDENEWNLDENDKIKWIMGDSEMKFKNKKISRTATECKKREIKNEIQKEIKPTCLQKIKAEIYTFFGS